MKLETRSCNYTVITAVITGCKLQFPITDKPYACVREDLRHGLENEPFLQRIDARRTAAGKATRKRSKQEVLERQQTIREAVSALEGLATA